MDKKLNKKRISPNVIALIGTIITLVGGFFLSYNYIQTKKVIAFDYMTNVFYNGNNIINISEADDTINQPENNLPETITNDYIGYLSIPKINLHKGFLDLRSPENDVDRLEEKIYRAFGVNKEDITHRRIGRYLDYYKGYVGSHLGYTIEDAMKFTWEHGLDSMGKDGYDHNLLYRAKEYRREFLEKLHDYTIGRKREPERDKIDQPNEVIRKLGTEQEKLTGDNHNQSSEVARGSDIKSEGPDESDNKSGQMAQALDTEEDSINHAEEKEKRDLKEVDSPKPLSTEASESDDFGSAFEGMEKRAEREEKSETVQRKPLKGVDAKKGEED